MEDLYRLCGGNDILPVGEMTTILWNNFVGESNPTHDPLALGWKSAGKKRALVLKKAQIFLPFYGRITRIFSIKKPFPRKFESGTRGTRLSHLHTHCFCFSFSPFSLLSPQVLWSVILRCFSFLLLFSLPSPPPPAEEVSSFKVREFPGFKTSWSNLISQH